MDIERTLAALSESGNLRELPVKITDQRELVDLSSNDYLGLATRRDLREEFFATTDQSDLLMSASASRLLAARQNAFSMLEQTIADAFGCNRDALVFNSGYHANSGIIPALCNKNTIILADRLVHASIIDGIKLSGAQFKRFRHNDYSHLLKLAREATYNGHDVLIIAESVYSMDGDRSDIATLTDIKRMFPSTMLYIDEAHAIGVEGTQGLGLCKESGRMDEIDITVGTFGKALASTGAFAIVGKSMKQFLVNRCRSLIFSTAIPPINVLWTKFIFEKSLTMQDRRQSLKEKAVQLHSILSKFGTVSEAGHIQPLIVGEPRKTVELSAKLRNEGFCVLPIRTPTVPPGTDRLRFSLNADITTQQLANLETALGKVI